MFLIAVSEEECKNTIPGRLDLVGTMDNLKSSEDAVERNDRNMSADGRYRTVIIEEYPCSIRPHARHRAVFQWCKGGYKMAGEEFFPDENWIITG